MLRVGLFGTVFIEDAKAWKRLPTRQQEAVLAHERGHVIHRHVLKRMLAKPFLSPDSYARMCHNHEYQADAYALAQGHGNALACALMTRPEESNATHPSTQDRVARLVL